MTTSNFTEEVLNLPLSEIIRSFTNRKTFTPQALGEMADSIKEKGVLQPIVVRPIESIETEEVRSAAIKAGAKYEIIMGERRYRASTLAGKTDIKAIVRPVSDYDALMVQVIENAQREDPQPLEEAEQYRDLLTTGKATIDDLAAKIGKSRPFIYQRVSLLRMPDKAKTALRNGKLSLPIALLIARIHNVTVADYAANRILKGDGRGNPFSTQEAHHLILNECMMQLKNAPFDTKDKTLVAGVGSCVTCPHRTGNEKELFADVGRCDVCTDPVCFQKKREAALALILAKAKEDGKKVLAPEESAKLYPYQHGQLGFDSPYIELDKSCPFASKKTWAQVIAKLPKEERPEILVAVDKSSTLHELIGRKEAGEAVRTLNLAKPAETRGDLSAASIQQRQQARETREHHERMIRTVDLALTAVLEKQAKAKDTKALSRLLLAVAVKASNFDTKRRVSKRHGFTTAKQDGELISYYQKLAKAAVSDPLAFALETLLWQQSLFADNAFPEILAEACKLYGIDTKKIEAEAKERPAKEESEAPVKLVNRLTHKPLSPAKLVAAK